MDALNDKGAKIVKVDFSSVEQYCQYDYKPVLLVIDNQIFRLHTWGEFLKIFFYSVAKTEDGYNFLSIICCKNISGLGRCIANNSTLLRNPCKFAKNMYVECLKEQKPQSLLDSYRHESENLLFIKCVKEAVSFNLDLWISEDSESEQVDEECEKLIAELSPKGKKNRPKFIKTKNFIAHLNAEVLYDNEKFYLRIDKEYDKKILLGDIVISDSENAILKQYMTGELMRLDRLGANFRPMHKKVFAFGLVRYAMKYYGRGTFFPYFKDEYGIDVKVNNQREIHEWFRIIMRQTGKTYDDNLPQKIDNISLHSFVTDRCSKQFFDYLFDFWRKELNRNIENMYGEGNEIFKALISEIKSNNEQSINNVMKHTSMALALNERSCRLRIRRFLKLMDECFWNGDKIPVTGNRFNELLREWMENPNGNFQKEYKITIKDKGTRGQKLLSKPQLQVSFKNSVFSLRLPQELLPHCTEEEYPVWKIEADGFEPIYVRTELMKGAAFLYVEETETTIPSEMLFERISMTLYSEKRKFVTFSIKEESIRFFKDDGKCVDHSMTLSVGNLYCYSKTEYIPQILYKDKQIPQFVNDMFVGVYHVEKGDIVLLNNNHAVQVGEKIYEGLSGEAVVGGVVAVNGDITYTVYSKLPKILFKASKEKIGGVAIMISGTDKPYRLTDYNYYEFKIDDSLDEIYAYLIDLNDFIKEEGCYQVGINVPNSQKQYVYKFCYLDEFKFKFDEAPYIFKDVGSLCFNKKFNIEIVGNAWEQTENENRLNLNFNPGSTEFSSRYIQDWKVNLQYKLASEDIALRFDIPIFLWRYEQEAEWAIGKPADIFLKRLPDKLYVKGPFDFNDKSRTKLFLNLKNSDCEDTDMFASPMSDKDCFAFPFGNFRSWLNQDIVRRQILLQLNGKEYPFVDVYCRSFVLNHNLVGDFTANKIYGNIDIFGDGEYTISVKKDDNMIAENIPLLDGKFELEIGVTFGKYEIIVYELFEDDSGFDSFNVEIGSYNLEIKDIKNLTQKSMTIREIKDINGRYAPISLDCKYRLNNLVKSGYLTLQHRGVEILGLWRNEVDEEQLSVMPMYECDICNDKNESFKGLLIFYNRVDIKSAVLLELTKDEAFALRYDSYRRRLISEAQADKFKKYERFKRTVVLQDDMYSFDIE